MFFAVALSFPMAAAADFQKTYEDAANRRITIFTLHGDIKLSGYDGKNIDISAVKKGPDSDRVEILDVSIGNQINIFPRYLESARNNATVDFEIRVPKELFYNAEPDAKPRGGRAPNPQFQNSPGGPPAPPVPPAPPGQPAPSPARGRQMQHTIYLKSNSGQITVSDVAGSIFVETGGRNIEIQNVEGRLYASSVSGDIKGLLKQSSRQSMLRFSSISGNISIQAPDDISAQVYIESAAGQVKTDFPLETKERRYGPGKFIQGKLGAGNHTLDIRSLSGAINFSKKPPEAKDKQPG
jgi:hypothetical protein